MQSSAKWRKRKKKKNLASSATHSRTSSSKYLSVPQTFLQKSWMWPHDWTSPNLHVSQWWQSCLHGCSNSPLAIADVIPHPSGPLSLSMGLWQQSCFSPSPCRQLTDRCTVWGKWASSYDYLLTPGGMLWLKFLFLLVRHTPVGVALFYSGKGRLRGIIHVPTRKRCKAQTISQVLDHSKV